MILEIRKDCIYNLSFYYIYIPEIMGWLCRDGKIIVNSFQATEDFKGYKRYQFRHYRNTIQIIKIKFPKNKRIFESRGIHTVAIFEIK